MPCGPTARKREDVAEGGVEVAQGPQGARWKCRVTFIHAVCAQSREAAGGDLGLPTGWTDFLCRVMPRTGLEDKGLGPQGAASGAGHGMGSKLMLFSGILQFFFASASLPVKIKMHTSLAEVGFCHMFSFFITDKMLCFAFCLMWQIL